MTIVKLSSHQCECRSQCGRFTAYATKTDARRGHVKGQPMRLIPGHNASNVGLMAAPELDELTIMRTRVLSDGEAAVILDAHLRGLEMAYKRSFVQRGLILLEMEERGLWSLLSDAETGQAYASLEKWIVAAATHSRSDCFAALKAVKELRDVPTEKLLDMPRVNVVVLQSLSKSVRKRPEVIKAAQSMSNREFLKEIEAKHPHEHIEERRTIHLSPVKSAKTVIDLGIQMGMVLEDVKTREDVLEIWAIDYVECNKEAYARVMKERA